MVLFIALLAGAVALAAFLCWLLVNRRGRTADYIGVCVVLAWVIGSAGKVYLDGREPAGVVDDMLATMGAASWGATANRPSAATNSINEVAPVDALIGGLEQRLADQPNDAKGWALLAQSYSFVGDTAAAERALQRAVELGFAESDLRGRVEQARRESNLGAATDGSTGG